MSLKSGLEQLDIAIANNKSNLKTYQEAKEKSEKESFACGGFIEMASRSISELESLKETLTARDSKTEA